MPSTDGAMVVASFSGGWIVVSRRLRLGCVFALHEGRCGRILHTQHVEIVGSKRFSQYFLDSEARVR